MNPIYGEPSIRTLPANRSLVIADSVFRDAKDRRQGPYDFICKLNGAAMVGNELIYQRLYWSQPLFAHSNASNELRFQINGDTTVTYVVYATPYLMFTQYDGNPPGTSFLPPKPYSYANNLEIGLNMDVRLLTSNYLPINFGTVDQGKLKDANGFNMTFQYRYSPSRGFVLSFVPSINLDIPVYTFRLLPCNYISEAHYVHGMGVITPESPTTFVPRDSFTVSYFSDDTPTLLPFRYIVVTSEELNKDRRMLSFQNSASSKFLNELAIIPLNNSYTGCFHSELLREDATVISKRDDYNPQSFRISISNENGDILICDDIINAILSYPDNDVLVPGHVKLSFIVGDFANRGNYQFMNTVLFGFYRLPVGLVSPADNPLNARANYSDGMGGFNRNTYIGNLKSFKSMTVSADVLLHTNGFPFSCFFTLLHEPDAGQNGFAQNCPILDFIQTPNAPPGDPTLIHMRQTNFFFYPGTNPTPTIAFDLTFRVSAVLPPPTGSVIYFWVGFYSNGPNQWLCGAPFPLSIQMAPILGATHTFSSADNPHPMVYNMNWDWRSIDEHNITIAVVPWVPSSPFAKLTTLTIDVVNPDPHFVIGSLSTEPVEDTYVEPVIDLNTNQSSSPATYPFGDPRAAGLCEDLIHEISTYAKIN